MILLGYDPMRQVTLAHYQGVTIVLDEHNPRAKEIFDDLCAIMQDLPESERELVDQQDDIEVVLIIQTPWSKGVSYSDQTWSDLLSIQRKN